jgi:hypothetical protein
MFEKQITSSSATTKIPMHSVHSKFGGAEYIVDGVCILRRSVKMICFEDKTKNNKSNKENQCTIRIITNNK